MASMFHSTISVSSYSGSSDCSLVVAFLKKINKNVFLVPTVHHRQKQSLLITPNKEANESTPSLLIGHIFGNARGLREERKHVFMCRRATRRIINGKLCKAAKFCRLQHKMAVA